MSLGLCLPAPRAPRDPAPRDPAGGLLGFPELDIRRRGGLAAQKVQTNTCRNVGELLYVRMYNISFWGFSFVDKKELFEHASYFVLAPVFVPFVQQIGTFCDRPALSRPPQCTGPPVGVRVLQYFVEEGVVWLEGGMYAGCGGRAGLFSKHEQPAPRPRARASHSACTLEGSKPVCSIVVLSYK